MHDLSRNITTTLQTVFIGRKLGQDLKLREIKPPIVINNALFSLLHVTCVIQIISAIQVDTFTNVLLKIKTLRSLTLFDSPWGYKPPQRKTVQHPKKVSREI